MRLTVQPFALAQHLRNVPCHDGVHLAQILVQLRDVALRPRVHVQLLCFGDERVCVNTDRVLTKKAARARRGEPGKAPHTCSRTAHAQAVTLSSMILRQFGGSRLQE